MTDATMTSLQSILQSDDYEVIENVPVFDEHDEYDREGNLIRRFGRLELQEIADKGNQREIETGDLCPFGPGHTIDNAPETSQPIPYGYVRNYRVERFGPSGKLAVICNFYIKKAYKAMAATFPRRSVELWIKDKMIDWIALLRRTPQRDLGLLTYEKDAHYLAPLQLDSLFYDNLKKKHLAGHLSKSGKLRYSMDGDMNPTEPPDALAPDEEFHEKFLKAMKHHFPHMHGMHAKYASEIGEHPHGHMDVGDDAEGAGEADDERRGPEAEGEHRHHPEHGKHHHAEHHEHYSAQISATNSSMPKAEKIRMSKVQEDIKLSKLEQENLALKTRLAKLEENQASTQKEMRRVRYERDLTGLVGQGYQFDMAEEMEMHGDDAPEKFAKHLESIKKNYQRGPVGDFPILGKGDDAPIASAKADDINDPRNRDKFEKATKYMREKGVDWDEAFEYAMKNGK